jgi:hypothetical protein
VAGIALRLLRAGGVAAALLCVSAGVAAADPLPVADVTQSADTDDGWHLSAALTRMTINSVPNMAATAFTREGFVTGKAAATIDGKWCRRGELGHARPRPAARLSDRPQ